MTKTGKERLLRVLLILGSILAAVKLIFVDYSLDEEYQIVMAYRQLSGDNLFGVMWEPHQTSAFACVFLMRIFTVLTGGTTGVVIFLRLVTTLVQVLLSIWLYRVLRRITEQEYAFLLGLCYFNIVPKLIQIPEFSNLQLWSITVTVLALACYYGKNERVTDAVTENGGCPIRVGSVSCKDRLRSSKKKGIGWLVLAGVGMSVSVLAYPADLVLFPFFGIVIFKMSSAVSYKKRWADTATFAVTCGLCGGLWLCAVLLQVEPAEFFRNLRYVVEFDLTHDLSAGQGGKWMAILLDFLRVLVLFGISISIGGLIGWGIGRHSRKAEKKMPGGLMLAVPTVLVAEGIQLVYWLVLQKGYEEPMLPLVAVVLLAVGLWRYADERKRLQVPCLGSGLLTLLAVLYMSDLTFFYAVPHALLGILGCVLVLIFALENVIGKDRSKVWIRVLLYSLCFLFVFGKGFTVRAGKTDTNTVLGLRGMIKSGPAAGTLTNYMQAYVNNCDYEDFTAYVEEGDKCLIVTNMVGTGGTSPYMFRDLEVCHFSIVDPTSYDERLLAYWELYPEKRPDVIVVDCWYGQLMEREDSWIMQFIENDFGYTRMEEGRYVRFYFRE